MTQFADVALFPLFALQALWVVARAERLPEPPGPRSGVGGDGPDLRLLILGDSSAAGVGAERQEDALSGQLAARLDRALTEAAPQAGFQYLPFTLPFRPDYMARDGFHPAPLAYRVWAETLGPHLLPGPSALP